MDVCINYLTLLCYHKNCPKVKDKIRFSDICINR